MAKPKTTIGVRLFVIFFAAALPALLLAASSCRGEGDGLGPAQGAAGAEGNGQGQCIGPTCEDPCEDPKPGCPCAVEGEHLLCGAVVAELEDGARLCGQGVSTCTGGAWAECQINNAVSLLPGKAPGQILDSLGAGKACTDNPCDPDCIDFVDSPEGLADAGTNIDASDAGITPMGEGGTVCIPTTCAAQGKDCGSIADGCGNLLDCGACSAPKVCGIATANVCSVPVSCTNLCLKQVSCANGATTTVTGTVYAPNGVEPLPNAIVYVPNSTPAAFSSTVSCDNCATVSGSPLVSTKSGADGTFKLTNMPVGTNIPLVIQIGRWRRQVTIPQVPSCVSTAVSASLTRLPRKKSEGDIPKMAFATGLVDAMECVFRKIGIADSEFTNPNGTGRIHLYAGGYAPGTYINNIGGTNGTPWESTLLGNTTTLSRYDIVLFPCQGTQFHYSSPYQKSFAENLATYANAGGRIFATHYSYIWLYKDNYTYFSPLSSAIKWNINQTPPTPDPQTGYIDTSFTKGEMLSKWLDLIGASSGSGKIQINTLRRDFDDVVPPTQRWMYLAGNPQIAQHVTFNTPLGASAASQCGRVVFSDFHVEDAVNAKVTFPNECAAGGMTAQEKLLEYMLFDLASCVTPDQPVTCTPTTCLAQGLNCGPAGDGCGGTLNCGTCPSPATCGGSGVQNVCGTPFWYNEGSFVRDYDATLCPKGTTAKWQLWSWTSVTPSDTRIEFYVQTASTKAGLATAPKDAIVFSAPPGPSSLVGTPAIAHAANVPSGTPDTELGAALVDSTLSKFGRPRHLPYLRVTTRLVPSTDKQKAPTLSSWDLQLTCVDSE